jgi:hypothetical protein
MKIYHGGYSAIENPRIIKSRFPKDFGEGFYCTELEKQASRWAKRYNPAVVSVFEYISDNSLNIMRFEELSEHWLDFIVDCRSGIVHDFDIVIGAMANDQIYNYISDFVEGVITREQFWVLAKFKYPTHQICFCTDQALNTLKFINHQIL